MKKKQLETLTPRFDRRRGVVASAELTGVTPGGGDTTSGSVEARSTSSVVPSDSVDC